MKWLWKSSLVSIPQVQHQRWRHTEQLMFAHPSIFSNVLAQFGHLWMLLSPAPINAFMSYFSFLEQDFFPCPFYLHLVQYFYEQSWHFTSLVFLLASLTFNTVSQSIVGQKNSRPLLYATCVDSENFWYLFQQFSEMICLSSSWVGFVSHPYSGHLSIWCLL